MASDDINGQRIAELHLTTLQAQHHSEGSSGGAADIDFNAAADVIDVSHDAATTTITVASGANITFSEDQDAGGGTTVSGVAASAATNSVNVTIADDATAGANSDDPAALTFTNLKTVNMTLADTSAGHDITALAAGTADINITGNDFTTTFTSITGGALTITNGDTFVRLHWQCLRLMLQKQSVRSIWTLMVLQPSHQLSQLGRRRHTDY